MSGYGMDEVLQKSRPAGSDAHLIGEGMLRMAMNDLNLSARACDRILKVARTIADLADSDHIEAERISEASQYRTLDCNLRA